MSQHSHIIADFIHFTSPVSHFTVVADGVVDPLFGVKVLQYIQHFWCSYLTDLINCICVHTDVYNMLAVIMFYFVSPLRCL